MDAFAAIAVTTHAASTGERDRADVRRTKNWSGGSRRLCESKCGGELAIWELRGGFFLASVHPSWCGHLRTRAAKLEAFIQHKSLKGGRLIIWLWSTLLMLIR